MKRMFFLPVLFLYAGSLLAQISFQRAVFFETDRHELTAEAVEVLDQLLSELQSLADYSVDIRAHTDDRGATGYNDRLAEKRAEAVQEYLAGHGVEARRTAVSSFGERDPLYANDSDEGRQRNRRVDMLVDGYRLESMAELWEKLDHQDRQIYTIDPAQPTRLTGERGTTLWIDAGAFISADGHSPGGPVEIVLEEAYDFESMLKSGLHTTAGGRLLQTGGMIYIGATAGGQPLQLRGGQSLLVAMPTDFQEENMELFYGATDSSGNLDWEAARQPFAADLEAALQLPPRPVMRHYAFAEPGFRADRSGEPEVPAKPRAPYEPHEPRRESIRYNPGFFRKLLLGKEKVRQQEEAIYQQKLAEYEAKKEKYVRDLETYKEEMLAYEDRLEVYRVKYEAWLEDMKEQKSNFRQSESYQKKYRQYQQMVEALQVRYEKEMADWEALRQQRLEEFEAKYDEAGNIGREALTNYFYQVNQLGWVNCDRFWDVPEEEKLALAIKTPCTMEDRIFILFREDNSILQVNRRQDGQFTTNPIPGFAPVDIIAIRVENGRPLLARHETTAASYDGRLEFKPCRLSDIRKELANL